MMKLKQLELTNENIGELLMRKDVYMIRFEKKKASFVKKSETKTFPVGVSFANFEDVSVKDLMKILEKEDVAIVQITLEES